MEFEPVAKDFESLNNLIEDYPWEVIAKGLENYAPYTDGQATIRLAKLLDELQPKSGKTKFHMNASERKAMKRRQLEQQLLYGQLPGREPKDSYIYHYLYLEKFRRQIADNLDVLVEPGLHCFSQAMQQPVPHSVGQGHVIIVAGGNFRKFSLNIKQIVKHRPAQCLLTVAGAVVFDQDMITR